MSGRKNILTRLSGIWIFNGLFYTYIWANNQKYVPCFLEGDLSCCPLLPLFLQPSSKNGFLSPAKELEHTHTQSSRVTARVCRNTGKWQPSLFSNTSATVADLSAFFFLFFFQHYITAPKGEAVKSDQTRSKPLAIPVFTSAPLLCDRFVLRQ